MTEGKVTGNRWLDKVLLAAVSMAGKAVTGTAVWTLTGNARGAPQEATLGRGLQETQ